MAYRYHSGIAGTTSPTVMEGGSVKSKGKGSHGVLGLVENLGKDIGETARGIPAGLVETVRHPVKSIEDMGKSTWHDWSPLFHGHLSQFGHQFYAHPLAPLLDITAAFDGGASLAGRVAKGLDAAGVASEGSKVARLAEYSRGGKVRFDPPEGKGDRSIYKDLSKNPAVRKRQEFGHAVADKLGQYVPGVFGKDVRFARMEARHTTLRKVAMMTQLATIVDAGKKLTGNAAHVYERIATKHSYNQLHMFAFRHPANMPVPKDFTAVAADPTVAFQQAVDKAKNVYDRKVKKVKSLQDTLAQQRNITAGTEDELKAQIAKHQGAIARHKAAPKNQDRSNAIKLLQTDVEMMRHQLGQVRDMSQAKSLLDRKRAQAGRIEEKFFGKRAGVTFEHHLANLDQRYLVSPDDKGVVDLSRVKKLDNGKNILIVPKHTAKAFGAEGARSASVIKKLYDHGTELWKSIILGYRPAFFVNNFVGNSMMYMLSHDPVTAFRGLHDALRNAKHDAPHLATDLEKATAKMKGGWQDQYFKDQLTNTLADSSLRQFESTHSRANASKVKQGLFGVTHNAADKFFRRATINNLMRDYLKNDETGRGLVQRYRDQGLNKTAAFNKAAEMALKKDARNGGVLRRGVSEKVMNTMGDYHTYVGPERTIREAVPFYAWDRHITRHVKDLYMNHSGKLAAMAQEGKLGTAETEKLLGDIPKFLQNSIPLSILGLHADHPSRHALLSTQGLNPYSTIPDIADAAGALFGKPSVSNSGESIGDTLNPFVESALSQLVGKDISTGAPAKNYPGGRIAGVIGGPVESFPQVELINRLLHGDYGRNEAGDDFPQATTLGRLVHQGLTSVPKGKVDKRSHTRRTNLYEKTALESLLGILGVPYKQESPRAASQLKKKYGG